MNQRLLSESQKNENKFNRYKRQWSRQWHKRRAIKIRGLASMTAFVAVLQQAITPEQSYELLFGHWHRCKFIVRELQRLEKIMAWEPVVLPQGGELLKVERPTRVLRASRRGKIYPDSFGNQLEAGREEYAAGVAVGLFQQADGDWLLLTHQKLEELLKGVAIPIRVRQEEYLVRLAEDCLVLHSWTFKPSIDWQLTRQKVKRLVAEVIREEFRIVLLRCSHLKRQAKHLNGALVGCD